MTPEERARAIERITDNSEFNEDGCRLWLGHLQPSGTAQAEFSGRQWGVHRLAWTLTNGDIPDGVQIVHHCDNRHCVNVAHMSLRTPRNARPKGEGPYWRPFRGWHWRDNRNYYPTRQQAVEAYVANSQFKARCA